MPLRILHAEVGRSANGRPTPVAKMSQIGSGPYFVLLLSRPKRRDGLRRSCYVCLRIDNSLGPRRRAEFGVGALEFGHGLGRSQDLPRRGCACSGRHRTGPRTWLRTAARARIKPTRRIRPRAAANGLRIYTSELSVSLRKQDRGGTSREHGAKRSFSGMWSTALQRGLCLSSLARRARLFEPCLSSEGSTIFQFSFLTRPARAT
jgi:hypothetical protein